MTSTTDKKTPEEPPPDTSQEEGAEPGGVRRNVSDAPPGKGLWALLSSWFQRKPSKSEADELLEQQRRGPPSWLKFWNSREAYYQRLEELTWNADQVDLRNLSFLLRAKREDSQAACLYQRRLGLLTSGVGIVATGVAIFVAVRGWDIILSRTTGDIPPDLWELVVATSGAVLLIVATATLLFRVAADFFRRADAHAERADQTRRIEAATRMLLAAYSMKPEAAQGAMINAALPLLSEPRNQSEAAERTLSAVPDLVKEVLELASRTVTLARTGGAKPDG